MPSAFPVKTAVTCLVLAAVGGAGTAVALAAHRDGAPPAATGASSPSTTGGSTTAAVASDGSTTTTATTRSVTTTTARPTQGTATSTRTGTATSTRTGTAKLSARAGLLRPEQLPLRDIVVFNSDTGRAAAQNFQLAFQSHHCWSPRETLDQGLPQQLAVADYGSNDHAPDRRALVVVGVWQSAAGAGLVARQLENACAHQANRKPTSDDDLVAVVEHLDGSGWNGFIVSDHYHAMASNRSRTAVVWAGRTLVIVSMSTFSETVPLPTDGVRRAALTSLQAVGAL